MEGPNFSHSFLWNWEANEGQLMQHLSDPSSWIRVPSLNYEPLETLADQQLVHFLGMVQDMQNPELFLEQCEVRHSTNNQTALRRGKYRDVPVCGPEEVFVEDSVHNVNKERQSLYCISVPGLNPWTKPLRNMGPARVAIQHVCNKSRHPDVAEPSPKRLCQEVATPALQRYLPLPDLEAKICLVKVYDSDENLALNDIIEVIGFVSLIPTMERVDSCEDMNEDGDVSNPMHQVFSTPRLHAVSVRKRQHCNPLVDHAFSNTGEVLGLARAARDDLRLVFTQVLLGDQLAADYLICHLISTVFQRSELMALGQFSVNLSSVPAIEGYCKQLYAVLEQLVTKSHYLPLTLDGLNKSTFLPWKDYDDDDRLVSGVLQLSAGTHLIVDETCLQPGQLQPTGTQNLSVLNSLIYQQKLDYNFKYYQLEFHKDVPVLVLSEGKSLLQCNVNVPLRMDTRCMETSNEIFEAAGHFLQESMLHKLRKYLTVMRHLEYTLSADMKQVIQDDFVSLRREPNSKVDLHLLLVLARLVSLSQGEQSLSMESWKCVCSMEQQRKQRLVITRQQ